ncbi:hypothetical protein QBK99_21680 [Corticibacterium sp. UT-5YL-CI-8]|nr:hypothetical protein [Tianweitania sp. UT-5YL-CI-8]
MSTTRLTVTGKLFFLEGDVGVDEILHPRHHGASHAGAFCLASRGFTADDGFAVIASSGLFGVGLVRPPVPRGLRQAGIRVAIAPNFSPLFVEHSLNAGMVLPVKAELPAGLRTGEAISVRFEDDGVLITGSGHSFRSSSRLPNWALSGQTWSEWLRAQTEAAGGLDAYRAAAL